MLYDIIQKYIESAVAELNNIELIREKGRTGRMALLLIVVAVWIISEILYFTTKLVPNLILIDLITILFLAEYMMFSSLVGSKFDTPMVYLSTFLINSILLLVFIFITGGNKSVFLMLPVFYLLLVFIIDSLIPITISFAVSIVGLVFLYASYGYQTSFVLMTISLVFVLVVGIYIQYRISVHKTIITTNPTLVQSIDNNGQDFSKVNELREILTKKEFEIAYYAIKGLSNEEIAAKLFIEETTIKFHLKNIFKKLNITSKIDLTSLFISPKTLEKFESSLQDNRKNGEDKGDLPKSIG